MTPQNTRTRKSTRSLALQRRQLDAKLGTVPRFVPPQGGWIRTIRQSLGMTLKQLGKRLGISPQGVRHLEEREASEGVTLAKLREAADALGCELQVVLVPKQSLEGAMQQQAALKSREERNKIVHTMRLEAQDAGVEYALDEDKATERWLTERIGRLWD